MTKVRGVVLTAIVAVMVWGMTAVPASALAGPLPTYFLISWKYVAKYVAYGYKCWPVGYGQYACY